MAKAQTGEGGQGLVHTPIINTFGIRYLEHGPGWVTAQFDPAEGYANHFGNVQGGVLAVYLDNIMGQCCYTLLPAEQALTTVEMTLHFLEPAPRQLLRGRAQVIKRGRRLFFVEAQVEDLQGRALARAVATMSAFKRPAGTLPGGEKAGR